MTPDLARRAGALCLAAEPHADEWPCTHHRHEAARQLSAVASTLATGGLASAGAGVDGATGPCAPAGPGPVAPPSEKSPPRASHTQGGGTGHRYGPQGA